MDPRGGMRDEMVSTGSIDRAVHATVRTQRPLVVAAAHGVPKAWGSLAARGVVRFRELNGRKPTDEERRAIWSGLWREVEKAREAESADPS